MEEDKTKQNEHCSMETTMEGMEYQSLPSVAGSLAIHDVEALKQKGANDLADLVVLSRRYLKCLLNKAITKTGEEYKNDQEC